MIYAICNPTAGNSRGRKIGQEIEKRLLEQHYACHLEMTKAPGHATELAYAAAQSGVETVLAIGGDGTAVEVARGLIGTPAALGVIPAGTGNDFIKTLGLPKDPLAALDFVLAHPARDTDVGDVNGRLFLNEINTKFDVTVLDFAQKAKRLCRGLLPYLYGVIRTLFHFRGIQLSYAMDGGEMVTKDVFVIAVANGGVIGGGIPIAPEAQADDGLLDVVVVNKIRSRNLPARLIGLMRGKILSFPETQFIRAKKVFFSADKMRVNIDGEVTDEASVEARLLPKALRIHW